MTNRIEEPVERLRNCSSFKLASSLTRETTELLGMTTVVRASEDGWEVLVPPGTAYEINHPEAPERAESRDEQAALAELHEDVRDEEDSLNRSAQTGWFYRD